MVIWKLQISRVGQIHKLNVSVCERKLANSKYG